MCLIYKLLRSSKSDYIFKVLLLIHYIKSYGSNELLS